MICSIILLGRTFESEQCLPNRIMSIKSIIMRLENRKWKFLFVCLNFCHCILHVNAYTIWKFEPFQGDAERSQRKRAREKEGDGIGIKYL